MRLWIWHTWAFLSVAANLHWWRPLAFVTSVLGINIYGPGVGSYTPSAWLIAISWNPVIPLTMNYNTHSNEVRYYDRLVIYRPLILIFMLDTWTFSILAMYCSAWASTAGSTVLFLYSFSSSVSSFAVSTFGRAGTFVPWIPFTMNRILTARLCNLKIRNINPFCQLPDWVMCGTS